MVSRIKRIWMGFWFKQVLLDGHYQPKLNWNVVSNIILMLITFGILYFLNYLKTFLL